MKFPLDFHCVGDDSSAISEISMCVGGIGCGTTASETDEIGPPPSKKRRTSARKKKRPTHNRSTDEPTDESDHEEVTPRRRGKGKAKEREIDQDKGEREMKPQRKKGLSLKKVTKRRRKGRRQKGRRRKERRRKGRRRKGRRRKGLNLKRNKGIPKYLVLFAMAMWGAMHVVE